jgi:hypothetical protein
VGFINHSDIRSTLLRFPWCQNFNKHLHSAHTFSIPAGNTKQCDTSLYQLSPTFLPVV